MIAILVPTSIPTCVPIPRFHRPCFKDSSTTGKSLSKSVVYQADVTTDDNGETKSYIYIGITTNQFKERYRDHVKSYQLNKYANNTELSKHISKLKENKRHFSVKWSIIKHVKAYKLGSQECNLC